MTSAGGVPRTTEEALSAAVEAALPPSDVPIRQKSAKGLPKPHTTIERTCWKCGASFIGLAPGKTGERGIWHDMRWYCSAEDAPRTTEERTEKRCALCGHDPACGIASATIPEGAVVRLCHEVDHSCYHRWTVYGERPLTTEERTQR